MMSMRRTVLIILGAAGGLIVLMLVGVAVVVLTLDPSVEHQLANSIRAVDQKSSLILEPRFAEQVLARIATQVERMMKSNVMPVLLCAPELRRHLRRITERVMPHLSILSVAEVPNNVMLKAFGVVAV